jgi:hypothetical protein
MASAYSTSSSIILSNVLATESCELRTAIDSYMDTKLKEFQEIMKSKVESVITGRLDKFYNKSFEDHEKVLFDNNSILISEYKYLIDNDANKKDYPLLTENTKCFIVEYRERNYTNHESENIQLVCFFDTFIIYKNSTAPYHPNQRVWNYKLSKHNISYDCLFAIKYLRYGANSIMNEHPEYFKKNCSDFESLCRREYAEIEKTKKQLKSLMDENMSKKDYYYASLDKKNKDFEQEKKQLEEERQKIKEEKEKMVFIKEKLV